MYIYNAVQLMKVTTMLFSFSFPHSAEAGTYSSYAVFLAKPLNIKLLFVSNYLTESIRNIARGVGLNCKMAAHAEVGTKML